MNGKGADSSRKRSKISSFLTEELMKAGRGRLPKFAAHDLRLMIDEATEDSEIAFMFSYDVGTRSK
jgi:hypothetical protein